MLKRPYDGQHFDGILALRNQFNSALEHVLSNRKIQHYILSIKVDKNEFYPTGALTSTGEKIFWSEVDECLRKFDRDEINLKPKSSAKKDDTANGNANAYCNSKHSNITRQHTCSPPRHRLPAPPSPRRKHRTSHHD